MWKNESTDSLQNIQLIDFKNYKILEMEQHILDRLDSQQSQIKQANYGTFRQFRTKSGSYGIYQRRILILMAFYWITASFFLVLPFYFFKKPSYCQNEQIQDTSCQQCLAGCVETLCKIKGQQIHKFIKEQNTLTFKFQLFCGFEVWRIIYKISPQSLSLIGLLIYGFIADRKGRKVAFKISWIFYTIGLLLYTITQAQFLVSLGYFMACINCFPSLVIQFILLFEQLDRSVRLKACYLLLSFLLIAPLAASFLAGILIEIGLKITLLILCTIPAIILSFTTGYLQQSAIYVYKNNKLLAFNIINRISKINKLTPISIDLSRSQWLMYDHYDISIWDILKHQSTKQKLLSAIAVMFAFFFNNKLAQISLDQFTNQYSRGMIMNGTSAFATLTVIIIITKYKINNYFYISIPYLLIAIVNVIYSSLDYHNFIVESIFSIILRYLSDLSYSLFLIWAIEAFPTVCRGRCLGLTLCGSSLGSIIAYSLKSTELSQYILSLLLTIMVALLSKYFSLDYENKLRDTLTNEYYDEKDRFKSV